MKKIFLIFLIAALFACNTESDTNATKGNTDTTIDSVAIKQDNTINRDTGIRSDTGLRDTSNRRDSVRK